MLSQTRVDIVVSCWCQIRSDLEFGKQDCIQHDVANWYVGIYLFQNLDVFSKCLVDKF